MIEAVLPVVARKSSSHLVSLRDWCTAYTPGPSTWIGVPFTSEDAIFPLAAPRVFAGRTRTYFVNDTGGNGTNPNSQPNKPCSFYSRLQAVL